MVKTMGKASIYQTDYSFFFLFSLQSIECGANRGPSTVGGDITYCTGWIWWFSIAMLDYQRDQRG